MRVHAAVIGASLRAAGGCADSKWFERTAPTAVIAGSGRFVSESRPVQGFTSITVAAGGRLLVTVGGGESLEITAEDNITASAGSQIELRGIDAASFAVTLSGGSTFTGSGSVRRLDIDLSAGSGFQAPALTGRVATARLSGGSTALLRVTARRDRRGTRAAIHSGVHDEPSSCPDEAVAGCATICLSEGRSRPLIPDMYLPDSSRARGTAQLCAVIALLLLVPFGLVALDARFGAHDVPVSYLPALEGPRLRGAFDPIPIEQLADMRPGYVIIGDSMAGTRVHTTRLRELTGRPVADLVQAGSGPVFWYLALKNWVIASRSQPKVVFIFFRDTNLTDILFRLDEGYRWNVDRVAGDREDEVNAAIAANAGELRYRVRSTIERGYGADRVRLWMVPGLTDRLARALVPGRERRKQFTQAMNSRFDFLHIRPIQAADVATAVDRQTEFDYYVQRSVLPLMLRDARQAGIRLCFVRVQRRPIDNRPPEQSEALKRYVARLRDYIVANGGIWRDDTGDPELTLQMYDDGDHMSLDWRARYTEILYERVRSSLQ